MTARFDSVLGCIVGGAIGDVLGGVSERKSMSISDDTQFTLATCEAITEASGVRPDTFATTFLRWYRARAFSGLGSATLKALRDLDAGAHWALAGARGEMAAGNGPAMRIAPLAFVLDPLSTSDRVVIRDVCRITHHSDEAYVGALAVLLAVVTGNAVPPAGVWSFAAHLPDSRVRDRLLAFEDLSPESTLATVAGRFGSSGYVIETVPLALFTAARITGHSFESILGELVAAGGDTDTIGSIAGQVAGARLGFSNIPAHLVGLPPVQAIVPAAEAFSLTISCCT